jgi:hypothetical protein
VCDHDHHFAFALQGQPQPPLQALMYNENSIVPYFQSCTKAGSACRTVTS